MKLCLQSNIGVVAMLVYCLQSETQMCWSVGSGLHREAGCQWSPAHSHHLQCSRHRPRHLCSPPLEREGKEGERRNECVSGGMRPIVA